MRADLLLTAFLSCVQVGPAAASERQPGAVLIIDEADPSAGVPTTLSTTLRRVLSEAQPHVAVDHRQAAMSAPITGPRSRRHLGCRRPPSGNRSKIQP